MSKKIIIGVMGPATSPSDKDLEDAFQLGKLIAKQGWILLTGGSAQGVMDEANRGAKENSGLTIGVMKNQIQEFVSR